MLELASPAELCRYDNKVNDGSDSGSNTYDIILCMYSVGAAKLSDMPYNQSDYWSWGNS